MNMAKRCILFLIILAISVLTFMLAVEIAFFIPEKITIIEDGPYSLSNSIFSKLFYFDINDNKLSVDNAGMLTDEGTIEKNKVSDENVSAKVKLLGVIPIKDVDVEVIENKKVAVCGNSVGIKLHTNGLLVVGITEFKDINNRVVSPGKDAGVKAGDIIKKVNGKNIDNIEDFSKIVSSSNGENITLTIENDRTLYERIICPKLSLGDKVYKLGLWVRDSTAGIGTLTFYDPESKAFGALGHGINDVDTGDIMPIKSGEVVLSNIVSVKKGEKGSPGELQGIFLNDENHIGNITKNSECGIYGTLTDISQTPHDKLYKIASKNEIKTGEAYILCNTDGQNIQKFYINILKVNNHSDLSTKNMIIKITDKNLIEKTGGIVQGMSGSPIIQGDKLIGAITHVFINDPTKGYAIFAETMFKNCLQK